MTTRRVLITGGTGQAGTELQRDIWPKGWIVEAPGRDSLDLCDALELTTLITDNPWDAIINAAAYTAVDRAESDLVNAWMINAMAPAVIAQICATKAIPIIHISTDYVFAGDKEGAWNVDDPVAPLGVYGASKLGGELAIRTSGARHAIVRTAWLISAHGNNFVRTMLRAGSERPVLRVVDDQRGSPTSAADLAQALVAITVQMIEDREAPTGIFHFSNAGATSWAGFAADIFRQSGLRGGPTAEVEPISSSEYPTPARRPSNSLLSHDAVRAAYGIAPRPWQDALSDILDELIGRKS